MFRKTLSILFVGTLLLASAGCREEGAAEKAGRKIDEAVEDLRHGGEGAMEKAGRKMDEAAEDVKESAEEMKKKMTEE